MSPQCELQVSQVGNGIGASLRGVDCLASDMAQSAFGRLFGSQGALVPALTILLTMFIALFAFALITGRTRIGLSSLTPRMVTLGLVLTLATSWVAYQTIFWNLAVGAPDQIASLITGGEGSATQQFGDKIDIVFAAIQEASGNGAVQDAAQSGSQGSSSEAGVSTFSPEGLMWLGATLLLLGTVGVLVTAKIALAVLMAIGPVFVVLALFPGTRGLFVGWLRGLAMLAITPLFAVLGGTMMLELAIPVINSLAPVPGQIDARAAMAFFLVGAVHVALMVLVLKTAATMVAGWRIFGFAGSGEREERDTAPLPSTAPPPVQTAYTETQQASGAGSSSARRIAISGITAGVAANDASGGGGPSRNITEIRNIGQGGSQQSLLQPGVSRARGIGSRFRAAPPKLTEKIR